MASQSNNAASPVADFKPTVFFGAIAAIGALMAFALLNADVAAERFDQIQSFATHNFGWLLVGTANIILILCAYLAFTRLGDIRLGGPTARPAYAATSWFAMLFSAGMVSACCSTVWPNRSCTFRTRRFPPSPTPAPPCRKASRAMHSTPWG